MMTISKFETDKRGPRDWRRSAAIAVVVTLWFCGLFAPLRVFPALPSDIVFEVRPTAGNNANGACFSATQAVASAGTGTDLTQFNGSQGNWTNLTTASAGATTLTDSSSTGLFTAAMQGNCIRITGGTNFAIGYYMIMSRTSANAVVLDRTPTSSAAGTAGTGNVGGASKGISSHATASISASVVFGTTIWVKNEAWNEAVTINGTCGSTPTNYCRLYGYNTTRGDNPLGDNRPHNNRAGTGTPFTTSGASNWVIRDIIASHSGTAAGFTDSGTGSNIFYFNLSSSFNTTAGMSVGSSAYVVNCEMFNNTTKGVVTTANNILFMGNYIHDNTTGGVDMGSQTGIELIHNIITKNGGHGIVGTSGGPYRIIGNTIDGNTGGSSDGVNIPAPSPYTLVFNNMFTNNGRYGVNTAGTTVPVAQTPADYNLYSGNASGARNGFVVGVHDVTGTPQYTSTASGDYSLQSSSAAIGSGWPGLFPPQTGTVNLSKRDTGAVQSGLAGGGGASPTLLFAPIYVH